MKLYLVQHAKAASKQEDPQRPLTDEGFGDIQKVAKFLRPLELKVDYIWHSGKKRAEQTAGVLSEVVEVEIQAAAHEGLGPNDDVAVLKEEIISDQKDVMVVGHMPFVSKLASLLLTGSETPGPIAFKQGGVICLNLTDENNWQIEWMIIPDLLK
jgi:phosphohistidine phosphatase